MGILPNYLIGDPERIKQILANLTGNAIKFSKEGKVEITCKVTESNSESSTLLFSIKDFRDWHRTTR